MTILRNFGCSRGAPSGGSRISVKGGGGARGGEGISPEAGHILPMTKKTKNKKQKNKRTKVKTWLNKRFSQFLQVSVCGPECGRGRVG